MSLTVYTSAPRRLVRLIKEGIESGNIFTWMMDDEGDFTHTPEQWKDIAWMTVSSMKDNESVTFGIIGRKFTDMDRVDYAVFHGRFAEMLLTHFDSMISNVVISSMPTADDRINN